MITGFDIVKVARDWVGVPYRHQGRSRIGVDCIGLAIMVVRELDLLPPEAPPFNYTRRPRDGALETYVARHCIRIETAEVGCMVLMQWANRAPPSHVGLLTPDNLIHAYAGNDRVVEHGFRAKWPARVHSYWRFAGVASV